MIVLSLLIAGLLFGAYFLHRLARARDVLGSEADRATHKALHIVSEAAPLLRRDVARNGPRAAAHLRSLLGCDAVAIASSKELIGWDGFGAAAGMTASPEIATLALEHVQRGSDSLFVASASDLAALTSPFPHAIVAALDGGINDNVLADQPPRVLIAFTIFPPSTSLTRAVAETARFVASQFELSSLDAAQSALAQAEITALRAQISPHFIYNSLNAIASYTRTDPEHARELLLDFAEFTRYSFRKRASSTTVAEELSAVEQYLGLEQARFGERLRIKLDIAPEALGAAMPYLCLQPLVENAVKHGIEKRAGKGSIIITARSVGSEVIISIDDDGVGMEPEFAARALAGQVGDGIGVANVDQRLLAAYGRGLDVETAPGAGTKVTLKIPKFTVVNP